MKWSKSRRIKKKKKKKMQRDVSVFKPMDDGF